MCDVMTIKNWQLIGHLLEHKIIGYVSGKAQKNHKLHSPTDHLCIPEVSNDKSKSYHSEWV